MNRTASLSTAISVDDPVQELCDRGEQPPVPGAKDIVVFENPPATGARAVSGCAVVVESSAKALATAFRAGNWMNGNHVGTSIVLITGPMMARVASQRLSPFGGTA